MSNRTVDGFFYGLFMDSDVLAEHDIPRRNPRRAFTANFELVIGNKATLWPSNGSQAYGMIYSLTHSEIEKLYSGTGLTTYKPEALMATTINGGISCACLCYNLAIRPSEEEMNQAYCDKLKRALDRLEFPKTYIESVK